MGWAVNDSPPIRQINAPTEIATSQTNVFQLTLKLYTPNLYTPYQRPGFKRPKSTLSKPSSMPRGLPRTLHDYGIRFEGVDSIFENEQSIVVGQRRARCRQGRVYWGADT